MRIWSNWNPGMLLVEMQNSTPTSEMLRFRSAVYWKYTYVTVYVYVCACICMCSLQNYFHFTLIFTASVNKMEILSQPQGPGAQVGGWRGRRGLIWFSSWGLGCWCGHPSSVAVESMKLQASITLSTHHRVSVVFLRELAEGRLDEAILQAKYRVQVHSVEEGRVSWRGTATEPGPGTSVTHTALPWHIHQSFSSAMGHHVCSVSRRTHQPSLPHIPSICISHSYQMCDLNKFSLILWVVFLVCW